MLTQFNVKNFRSIRDEVTLDLQATSISEHKNTLIQFNDEYYLPISVIYGPNGGGKSNVIRALFELRAKIYYPVFNTSNTDNGSASKSYGSIVPFALDNTHIHQPTEYVVYFSTSLAEYRYSIDFFNDKVLSENLDMCKISTGRISNLFQRNENNVSIGSTLKNIRVSNDISSTLPVLSYLGIMFRNNEIINDCISWFESGIDVINCGSSYHEDALLDMLDLEFKDLALKMFKEMDLDIVDFRIENNNSIGEKIIYTTHINDNVNYEINLKDESSGTRKLFSLISFIVSSLINGKTLVIDELDAKLHPLLLKYLITRFTDKKVNRKGAQLIFTSHDLSTMNNQLFRRDEIWFVAKGAAQNSNLYSLVEFKSDRGETVRKDAKYDKQYLEGKYGADPYLRNIIDWSVPSEE